jgi:hypothetical protein
VPPPVTQLSQQTSANFTEADHGVASASSSDESDDEEDKEEEEKKAGTVTAQGADPSGSHAITSGSGTVTEPTPAAGGVITGAGTQVRDVRSRSCMRCDVAIGGKPRHPDMPAFGQARCWSLRHGCLAAAAAGPRPGRDQHPGPHPSEASGYDRARPGAFCPRHNKFSF